MQGGRKPAAARAEAALRAQPKAEAARPAGARALRPTAPGWFHVPAGIHLHPGHTWARLEPDGLVAVGADDLAHKLVGQARVKLPSLGDHVLQGEPALEIGEDDRTVPMVSPVDGTVVAVNAKLRETEDGLEDPYDTGWLFKVKAPRLAANLRQLLREGAARRFMEEAEAQVAMRRRRALGIRRVAGLLFRPDLFYAPGHTWLGPRRERRWSWTKLHRSERGVRGGARAEPEWPPLRRPASSSSGSTTSRSGSSPPSPPSSCPGRARPSCGARRSRRCTAEAGWSASRPPSKARSPA